MNRFHGSLLPRRIRCGRELRDAERSVCLQQQLLAVLRMLVERDGGIVIREEIVNIREVTATIAKGIAFVGIPRIPAERTRSRVGSAQS